MNVGQKLGREGVTKLIVKNREGGQHDQQYVKNIFVKNRVGGRGVNLNLDNVFKYSVFLRLPLSVTYSRLKLPS